MSVWAIVVAAGKGVRADMGRNKVFCQYRGQSVLGRCLRAVRDSGVFDGVAVVLSVDDMPIFHAGGLSALADVIAPGGVTRQESVRNGLDALPEDAEIVSIHDGARPFALPELFRATVASAREHGSGVICTPVVDTIKQIDPDTGRVSTPDRGMLRAVQTPQSFRLAELRAAHAWAKQEGISATDDAALYEKRYGTVRLVEVSGAEKNRKFTTKEDFREREAEMQNFRIGTGYDAHRLKEGRKLILGGIEIPYHRGLDGHSDADAAVHALMDAMLGALALGDIGQHFPDTDPAYRGISSVKLLEAVTELVRCKGYAVGNADITIVAQKPKLASFLPRMRECLAKAMGILPEQVSVKATTTERMGFEGEEIGISAQSVVLLQAIQEG